MTKPFTLILLTGEDSADPRLADVIDYALDLGAYLEIRTQQRYVSNAVWRVLHSPGTQLRVVYGPGPRPYEHSHSLHAVRGQGRSLDIAPGTPIGQVIRDARLARGWTQRQLSETLSMQSGTHWGATQISNWERHKQRPPMEAIKALGEALGLGREDLRSASYARFRPQPRMHATRTRRGKNC